VDSEQQASTRRFISEETHGILQIHVAILSSGAESVSKESKLEKMRALAAEQCHDLMKEKYAIGAFLFGSAASGDINEGSDIDLAVVYNTVAADIHTHKEERKVDSMRLEVWRYPIAPFTGTFEDGKLRDKPDTWMWTGLWIESMQEGVILADPTIRLAEWKAKAKQWKWHESEIKPVLKQAQDNLAAAKRYMANNDSFASLICLREALTCLSAAHVMKHDLNPSFRPKDLSQRLDFIKDKEKQLSEAYENANDATALDRNLVEGLFLKLKEFVDSEWGTKRMGPRSELENAKSCLNKRNLLGALLSLRYCAYWLGYHIINKTEHKLPTEICNGENHVQMTKRLAQVSEPFYSFYKQLNFAERWNTPQVEAAINQTQAILDNRSD
jgi:predicted nucleotidyltransferase